MHQIQQHILNIDCSSQPFGNEVQSVVADLMEKQFYPKLEILLDKYKLDNATWILDKIDINLPSISNKNWKNELVDKSLQEIENYLNDNYKVIRSKFNHNIESSNRIMIDTQYAEFLFFEYLKTGMLKQESVYKTILDIENQLVEQTFSSIQRTKNFCNELVKLMIENPKSLMRLIYTISNLTKGLLRKEGVGLIFEIEPYFKNKKGVSSFFSSSQEFSNWINLLEWSLYFFASKNNTRHVVDQFKTSSFSNFQLNEIKIINLLDFLINSSNEKITKNHQDLLVTFSQKINNTSKEIDFKTKEDLSAIKADEQKAKNDILIPEIRDNVKIDSEINENKIKQNENSKADESHDSIKLTSNFDSNKNFEKEGENFENNKSSDTQNQEKSESNFNNVSSKSNTDSKLEGKTESISETLENRDNERNSKTANENKITDAKIDSNSTYKRFNLEDNNSENILLEPSDTQKTTELNLEEPIYIENAGLVILHPFLIHLFEQLKLCKNEEWTSNRNQSKAVLLTQFLISGKAVFYENELVLNKLLCGLEVDAVIDISIKLSKKEKTEANDLLKAVIAYWKVLKNTSIDGLRETFLQRNGKLLFKNEESIELWVEQKGVDVLMAQIPWGIGMVKTPWMKSFIECNWN